jgi:hypothetical protein
MSDQVALDLVRLLPSISIGAFYLVGAVYASSRRRRHPKVALLATVALLALLAQQVLSIWLTFFASFEPAVGESAISLARRLRTITLTLYVLLVSGTGLLIVSVFSGREPDRRDA